MGTHTTMSGFGGYTLKNELINSALIEINSEFSGASEQTEQNCGIATVAEGKENLLNLLSNDDFHKIHHGIHAHMD